MPEACCQGRKRYMEPLFIIRAHLVYQGPSLWGVHTPREAPRKAVLQSLHQTGQGIQDRLMQSQLSSHSAEGQETLHEASCGSFGSLCMKEVVVLVVAVTPIWA